MGWTSLINPIEGILDKFIPDKDERNRLAHEISTMAENHAHEIALQQIEVNKVEAASASLFKSGWRPFLGWGCGIAFLYAALLEPVMRFVASIIGYTGDFPVIDTGITMQVLMGMLGLGVLRTREKEKGVASK